MTAKKEMLISYYRIRKIIGILGIILPFIIVIIHGSFLPSISHYYYTKGSVAFIAILATFGLFLIAYKGYEQDKKTEIISDNVITHIGGITILIVVLLPTACLLDAGWGICDNPFPDNYPLFGHNNKYIQAVHLTSAGIFFFTMGWISALRFSKGKHTTYNKIYKTCGYIVWTCLGLLILEFIARLIFHVQGFTPYDVYILETIGIVAFGIAWLIKGKFIKDLLDLKALFQ